MSNSFVSTASAPSDDPRFDNFRIRPGTYCTIAKTTPWWERHHALHLERLRAQQAVSESAVAVLQSAVLIHGGSLASDSGQAHVWTPWSGHAATGSGSSFRDLTRSQHRQRLSRRSVVRHSMDLDCDSEIESIDGLRVTDLATTILQSARFLPVDDAFVAVDSLLAVAVKRGENWRTDPVSVVRDALEFTVPLIDRLKELPGQRGVKQARTILRFASPLSESPSESNVRRLLLGLGYQGVEPQMRIATKVGIKWGDVGIRSIRTVWEPNGDIKYEGAAGHQRKTAEDARRTAITWAGYRVVDLTTSQSWDSEYLGRSFAQYAFDM